MVPRPGFCVAVGNRKVNKRQRQLQQSIEEAGIFWMKEVGTSAMCQLCVTPCTATHAPYMWSARTAIEENLGEVSAYSQGAISLSVGQNLSEVFIVVASCYPHVRPLTLPCMGLRTAATSPTCPL